MSLFAEIMLFHYEQDEAKKKALKETAINETIPYYMGRFDALAEKNKGHLALGRVRVFPKCSQNFDFVF
jgi:hypothetical protein